MKTVALITLLVVVAAGSFVAGGLRGHNGAGPESAGKARKILYYVDPMNPAHTSDGPGLAPCGMKMEPVYADTTSSPHSESAPKSLAVGTVMISPARQQLAGIQVVRVEKRALSHTVRLPGRVAVDESRVYRIKAAVNGRIGGTLPCGTGSRVRKDEVLADLNSPELLPAVQALLFALNTRDQPVDGVEPGVVSSNSLPMIDLTYQQSLEALRHLGMGQRQLDEVVQTRKLIDKIAITSPANGVLTARHVSDELHVEKGEELFRVADLSQVWILADLSGWESEYVRPGSQVRVSVPRQTKTFMAAVSQALPLFDNDTRTLKVRLEVDNPDYALRPDMFVDVELSVTLPELILISADAVLDSGRRQTVFVDQGDGIYEPKEVKTGRHLGDLVEIMHGLIPGERIVTSGSFLLDSESRMKQAAAGMQEASLKDPVCGMTVDEQEAEAAGQFRVYQGRTYYFCNEVCKHTFDAGPARVLKTKAPASVQTVATTSAVKHADRRP